MPTYSTLDTIQEVMADRNCISWRVMDEDENQLHNFAPKPTTLWRDSFNTLKKFLDGLTGTNYVLIRVYAPEYTKGKGGDTATTIFTYYYRIKGSAPEKETVSGGMDTSYMALFKEMQAMRMEFAEKEHKRELEELRRELKEVKKEDGTYFERVAKVIGKEMGKEWLKAEGYAVDDEGVPTGERISGTADKTKKPETEKKDAPEKVQSVFKRTGDATVRIMKVSKTLGSDYEAVAESFEDIASLAENNPLKLKQLFDKLKEEKE